MEYLITPKCRLDGELVCWLTALRIKFRHGGLLALAFAYSFYPLCVEQTHPLF